MRIAFDLKTAMGIGDAVCGLYVAAGLTAAGHAVVLSTKHHAWLQGCKAPVGIGDFGDTRLDAAERYTEQLVFQRSAPFGASRSEWFVKNIERQRGDLGSVVPIIPEFNVPLEKPPVSGPYVMINPFSAHTERVWSGDKFRELAAMLVAEGITPVAIGSHKDARSLQTIFKGVKGTWFFWHQTPAWVRSAMLQSLGFVGNDSGMTHIAASLRVPTVAVVSHLRPDFVFSPGQVAAVTPDMTKWACRFCGWQKASGFKFHAPCLPTCAALQSISVASVFEAVQKTCLQKAEALAA